MRVKLKNKKFKLPFAALCAAVGVTFPDDALLWVPPFPDVGTSAFVSLFEAGAVELLLAVEVSLLFPFDSDLRPYGKIF